MPPLRRELSRALFLAGIAGIIYGHLRWTPYRLRLGVPWILAGILTIVLAWWISPFRQASVAMGGSRLRTVEKWFLVLLVVGGGAVRFLWIDHLPPGGFFDEVQNLFAAQEILAGSRPIFIGGATQMPALFFYLLAAAVKVAGMNMTTVRGVSALLGTLTLPVFYFLARRAFVWPVAAASTLLLAASRWHITFSRVGFVSIVSPLLEILAVLCLWKAAENGTPFRYALLGIVIGIGLQTYYSFALFPAVLLVAAVNYAARRDWRTFGPEMLRVAKGFVWAVLVSGMLLFPLIRFAVRDPRAFFQRSNTVAIWNPAHHVPWPGALWTNTVSHLLMFGYEGDHNPRHNIPGAPLLDPITAILLVIGLALAISSGLRWPQTTFLAWFAIMLLPAILTIEAPQAHRAVGAIPAVYLLIGQGLQGAWTIFRVDARRSRALFAGVLLLGLVLTSTAENIARYFRVQVRGSVTWQEFQADYHEIGRFLKPFRDRRDIWVSALYIDYPSLRLYLGNDFPYAPFLLSEHFPLSPDRLKEGTEGALYILEPFQKGLYPLFKELYPDAQLQDHKDPYGRTMFVSIAVPRRDVYSPAIPSAGQFGFLGVYYQSEEWAGSPALLRRDPAVFYHFHWHREALPGAFTADWAAALQVEEPGEYVFDIRGAGLVAALLDGRLILSASTLRENQPAVAAARLSRGDHVFVVRYLKSGSGATIYVSWHPPVGPPSVIPLHLLRPLNRVEYERLRGQLPHPGAP